MTPVQRDDPYASYNFRVEIQGISDDGNAVSGSFSHVSGLGVEIQAIEYRSGSEPMTVRKIPGLKKYSNIVLKRGFTGHVEFWNWLLTALHGTPQRTSGSIILLDEGRNEVARWNFVRGWPCKWDGPTLDAQSNDIAIDTLEICHEGLELEA